MSKFNPGKIPCFTLWYEASDTACVKYDWHGNVVGMRNLAGTSALRRSWWRIVEFVKRVFKFKLLRG